MNKIIFAIVLFFFPLLSNSQYTLTDSLKGEWEQAGFLRFKDSFPNVIKIINVLDYGVKNNNTDLRITKYYYKEDVLLPISTLESNEYNRISEFYGTGISFNQFSDLNNINIKYSNKILNLNRYNI